MCETIRKTLKKKIYKERQVKLYKIMATPVLTYNCEAEQ